MVKCIKCTRCGKNTEEPTMFLGADCFDLCGDCNNGFDKITKDYIEYYDRLWGEFERGKLAFTLNTNTGREIYDILKKHYKMTPAAEKQIVKDEMYLSNNMITVNFFGLKHSQNEEDLLVAIKKHFNETNDLWSDFLDGKIYFTRETYEGQELYNLLKSEFPPSLGLKNDSDRKTAIYIHKDEEMYKTNKPTRLGLRKENDPYWLLLEAEKRFRPECEFDIKAFEEYELYVVCKDSYESKMFYNMITNIGFKWKYTERDMHEERLSEFAYFNDDGLLYSTLGYRESGKNVVHFRQIQDDLTKISKEFTLIDKYIKINDKEKIDHFIVQATRAGFHLWAPKCFDYCYDQITLTDEDEILYSSDYLTNNGDYISYDRAINVLDKMIAERV